LPEISPFSHAFQMWSHVFMRHVMTDFSRSARQWGISMPQLSTLFYLRWQEHCGVSDIGESLGVTSAAASQMIDRMVALGLLERSEDPLDRRAKHIVLTSKGIELVNQVVQARQQWFEDVRLLLDPHQQAHIAAALGLLVDAIQAAAKPGWQASPCILPRPTPENTSTHDVTYEGTPD
jgi:DNA-binding MarR family transcriptional regulator